MSNSERAVIAEEWKLESGEVFKNFTLSYRIFGDLTDRRKPLVWVCHALTANDDPTEWWPGLMGEGSFFNFSNFNLICVNMPGSCYGSSGPISINPDTHQPYLHDFPRFTIRDISRAFEELARQLNVEKIDVLIGGSMGGQTALQWAVDQPKRFSSLILIATNPIHSPWGIAFNESQRRAIELDPTWGKHDINSGAAGMKVARSIALLSYRNYGCYGKTQPRTSADDLFLYRASSYQAYQGEKLAKRFNAISYHRLSAAMDSHDISRGYQSIEAALTRLEMPVLAVSMQDDLLFPSSEQKIIADGVKKGWHKIISTDKGHDGFLIETDRLGRVISSFLIDQRIGVNNIQELH